MQILPHKNYETPRSPDSTNTSQRSMRILMEGGEGHLLVHQMFVSYLKLTCLWNRRTSLFVLTYYTSTNLDLVSHEYWNKLSLRILSAKTILPWLRIHLSLKCTLLWRAYGTSFYSTQPSPTHHHHRVVKAYDSQCMVSRRAQLFGMLWEHPSLCYRWRGSSWIRIWLR